ncbi:MAG: pseudouridine synthase [Bacteroidetes bacterium]|nr:pseudouridine synthase [Bacteroidota bacterium]
MTAHRYFVVHKPVNMVSQFISSHDVNLLGSLDFDFPEGTHAIGRLDNNSEGLLLLTTNKKVTKLLFQGHKPHTRTYLVQVKNKITPATADALASGIQISAPAGSAYVTSPCVVAIVEDPTPYQHLFDASILTPATPMHQNVVTSWVLITLTEGKFHQVRKMVAAVHHRCIRLLRVAIEDIYLGSLPAGAVQEIQEEDFFKRLALLPT